MNRKSLNPYLLLAVFAAVSTASIALQNILWLALALWFFEQWRQERPIRFPHDSFAVASLVFLSTFFLGGVFGVDPSQSLHTVHKYLALLVFFPIAAMRLDFPRVERLLIALTAGSAFCAAYGIGKYILGIEGRITSFSGHWMVFGGLLMVALLLQVYLVKQHDRGIVHWLLLALLAVALILTQTRGAWFGFAAGFAWFAHKTDKRFLGYGAVAVLVGFLLLPAPVRERVKSIWDSKLSYSNMERICIWQAGWEISKDHPIFGIGQGNMEKVYPRYRVPGALEPTVGHMHNNFMQVLVQNGWVGLMAYLAWIGAYFRGIARSKPRHPAERRLDTVLTAVFIATLVWGLTEYTFSHQFMMVQVFLLGLQFGMMERNSAITRIDAK